MLEAGAAAPDVRLVSLSGDLFVLAEELKKSAVVLVFFKISCPTCQFTLPFLERLYGSQTAAPPQLVGISQDSATVTHEFNRHFKLSFPTLVDPAQQNYPVSNAYRITNVPSMFLIEQDGRVAWSLNGFHKAELETLGERRFGRSPFQMRERIPAMRPG